MQNWEPVNTIFSPWKSANLHFHNSSFRISLGMTKLTHFCPLSFSQTIFNYDNQATSLSEKYIYVYDLSRCLQ